MKEKTLSSDNIHYGYKIKKLYPYKSSTYEKPPIVYLKKCLF